MATAARCIVGWRQTSSDRKERHRALKTNGLTLAQWPDATRVEQWFALKQTPWAIQFIRNPTRNQCTYALQQNSNTLAFIPSHHRWVE